MHVECQNCGNESDQPERDWFVFNDRLQSWRCTKCGSYDVEVMTHVA